MIKNKQKVLEWLEELEEASDDNPQYPINVITETSCIDNLNINPQELTSDDVLDLKRELYKLAPEFKPIINDIIGFLKSEVDKTYTVNDIITCTTFTTVQSGSPIQELGDGYIIYNSDGELRAGGIVPNGLLS